MRFNFTRTQILIGTITIALIAIIGGVSAALISSMQGHQVKSQETFKQFTEGFKPTVEATPPNTMFVTKASEQAWEDIFPFVGQIDYLNTPYDLIGEGATHFMSVNANADESNGGEVVRGSYQYPVLSVIYKEEKQAQEALKKVESKTELSDHIRYFSKGNLLYMIPSGTYEEDNLTVESLPEKVTEGDMKSWGVTNDKSFWYIDFGAFLDSYTAIADTEQDKKAIREIAASLGVTENTYWVGTSSNLTDWNGRFYKLELKGITPQETIKNLQRYYKLTPDLNKPEEWEFSNPQVAESLQDGLSDRQSILAFYTLIADKNASTGQFVDSPDPTEQLPIIENSSPFALSVKLSPNAWVGLLKGNDAQDAKRIIYVNSVQANIMMNGQANLKLDLITKKQWEEALANWGNGENNEGTVLPDDPEFSDDPEIGIIPSE